MRASSAVLMTGWCVGAALAAACSGSSPRPHPPTPSAIAKSHVPIHVRVAVGPKVDASLPRSGTMFAYWMTKAEYDQVISGSLDLTPLARMLDRLVVIGPKDLTTGEGDAVVDVPTNQGDIVISLVLDSHHDGIGSLLGNARSPDGDVMGDSKPVHVGASSSSSSSAPVELVLDQVVQHPLRATEGCTGPNHEVVTLDAPEVAGAMHNATSRRVCVVLPASYATSPARRFPVVYEFPGWGSDDSSYLSMFHHDAVFQAAAPDVILALVDTSTVTGSSYLVDSPRTGQWDTYVAKRVIPAIDAKYRTIARREGRATAGLSTGGFGALSFGLRHPELIGVVTASSPDGPDVTRWLFGDAAASVAAGSSQGVDAVAANRYAGPAPSSVASNGVPGGGVPGGVPGGGVRGGGAGASETAGAFVPIPAWTRAMLDVEVATGGAGFFASYGNDWSPDDSARGWALPIDPKTGALVPEVIGKWRAQGPSMWLDDPQRAAAIKTAFSGNLCLSVGERDEFDLFTHLQAFADKLTKLGIEHEMLIAEGGHIDPDVMTKVYRCAAAHLAH